MERRSAGNVGQRMKERFLFVRPPRPVWPLSGPSTAFWPPLAFASLAAALRERAPDLQVEILDAPILRMGWRTLADELRRRRPAYVGIGEEAVSCVEGLRLARMAREVGAQVVAGGCFFGHVAPEVLETEQVDVVVHGEGEATVVELVEGLRSGDRGDQRRVRGISYRDDGHVVFTGHRPLIEDLDTLPFPAYDLLPVARYGRESRNHPRFACLELGRGCVDSCAFCVLWRQMGKFRASGPTPRLRVKSPARLLEEIRVLTQQFDRGYLGWVDPCFNADPRVPAALAERMLRENLHIGQSAWMRVDGIVRDDNAGALDLCVRAGLNEVYLGIERDDADGLRALGKHTRIDQCRQAVHILRRRYPHVYTIGSFIYGVEGDTPRSVRAMHRAALDLGVDKAFFIPLTPLPGTPYWRPELWDPSGERFREFSFLPHATGSRTMPDLHRALVLSLLLDWMPARTLDFLFGWTARDPRKRRIRRRISLRALRHSLLLAFHILSRRRYAEGGMVFPPWYNR